MSPVLNHPSGSKVSDVACSLRQYPRKTCGPLVSISPSGATRMLVPISACPTVPGFHAPSRLTVRVGLVSVSPVSYTHLRAHETVLDIVCRLLLEKKKNDAINNYVYKLHITEPKTSDNYPKFK